mmetsp:Transcript_18503/g.51836  ORF Transcript_18503/g.51836 Transcript_18503/m.51836 type:complete len:346 (-) Transcript_18503:383-1420(-)
MIVLRDCWSAHRMYPDMRIALCLLVLLLLSGPATSQSDTLIAVQERNDDGLRPGIAGSNGQGRETVGAPEPVMGSDNAAAQGVAGGGASARAASKGSTTRLPEMSPVSTAAVSVEPEPRSGNVAVQAKDAKEGDPLPSHSARPCDKAFDLVVSTLLQQLQTNFSTDITASYLNLMLPLQSAMASLSRVLLLNGSDQPLLEFIFQQVTRIDGDAADVSLELNSRGLITPEAACSPDAARCSGGFGCGECSLEAPRAFIQSLTPLSHLTVCTTQPNMAADINGDFACLFELMVNVLSQLSQAYLEVDQDGFDVDFIALDAIELADEINVVLDEWKGQRGLVCSMLPM